MGKILPFPDRRITRDEPPQTSPTDSKVVSLTFSVTMNPPPSMPDIPFPPIPLLLGLAAAGWLVTIGVGWGAYSLMMNMMLAGR